MNYELGKWGSGEMGGVGRWGAFFQSTVISELKTHTKSVEYRLHIRTGKRQEARGKRGNK
jgi:hypothetical protein